MNKPNVIKTQSMGAAIAAVVLSPIVLIAVACLCFWAVCTWPAELVGVGEWVRALILETL